MYQFLLPLELPITIQPIQCIESDNTQLNLTPDYSQRSRWSNTVVTIVLALTINLHCVMTYFVHITTYPVYPSVKMELNDNYCIRVLVPKCYELSSCIIAINSRSSGCWVDLKL